MAAPRKEGLDWEAIEKAYRETLTSVASIAKTHNCSPRAIRDRANREGWIRPGHVAGEVRERAEKKAIERYVPVLHGTGAPAEPPQDDRPEPPKARPINEERLEELGQVGADILISHRKDLHVMRRMLRDMSIELDGQNSNVVDHAAALEEYFKVKAMQDPLRADAYKQQLNRALHGLTLQNRSKTLVNLVASGKNLIELERKAWRLDADTEDNRTYEELLAEILADRKMRESLGQEVAEEMQDHINASGEKHGNSQESLKQPETSE